MKTSRLSTVPLSLAAATLALLTGGLQATTYTWLGTTDAGTLNAAGNWSGGSVPAGATATQVTIGAGDSVVMDQPAAANDLGAGTGSTVTVAGGGTLQFINGGWGRIVNAKVDVQSGGLVDVQGNGDSKRISWVNLSGNGTLNTTGRFDIRDGYNHLDLNGFTLTKTGADGLNFNGTAVTGGAGSRLAATGGYISVEGATTIPSTVTLDMTNTTLTSWDGAGRTIDAQIVLRGTASLNGRYNDAGKIYTGQVTLDGGSTTINPELNGNPGADQAIVLTGKITDGPTAGKLNKVGGGTLILQNATNNYTGGTSVTDGTVRTTGLGNIAPGTLDVTGNGRVTTILTNGQTILKNFSGSATGTGIVQSNGTNATLSASNKGLNLYHDGNTVNSGVDPTSNPANALGYREGVAEIDSAAKPYGDNNRWYYSGQIVNTTGSTVRVAFGEEYDDEMRVTIDGSDVLNNTAWDTATTGATNLTAGAHPIVIQSFDGVGGAGPNHGWNKGVGVTVVAGADPTVTAIPPDDATGLADANKFSAISNATLPAGLALTTGQDVTNPQTIGIGAGAQLTVDTTDMLAGKSFIQAGAVSGAGTLGKAGAGNLLLANGGNSQANTWVRQGSIQIGADGAIPNGSHLDLNPGTSVNLNDAGLDGHDIRISGGSLAGSVSGAAKVVKTNSADTLTLIGGSTSLTNTGGLEIQGGTVNVYKDNAFASVTGAVNVTGNTTIKPQNQGLEERHDGNAVGSPAPSDVNYLGIKQNIADIDSTAKPYGDNNRWYYSGTLSNTTGSTIRVAFGEQYDDFAYVKIDSTVVLNDGGWNSATTGAIDVAPGDHTITIQSFDGVGGAGPNSGWDKGIGITQVTGADPVITDINGGGDNSKFGVISTTTLPAGLVFKIGSGNISDTKNIAIASGVTATVNTGDMIAGTVYTLSGNLSGGGGLVKSGSGTLNLTGVSSYTGSTTVEAGTLKVNGTIVSPDTSVLSGATLAGGGIVTGDVIVFDGGHISPGNSIGTLATGNLTIAGIYDAEIATVGLADLIDVTGTVDVSGGTLNLTLLSGTPALGETYLLVRNDGADAVTGQFAGYADGAMFSLGGATFTIDYQFDSLSGVLNAGNDIALRVVPEPAALAMGLLGVGLLRRRRRA